ncbi:hypothetical protein JCM11491_007114 [Sporobolomyces phaffii]
MYAGRPQTSTSSLKRVKTEDAEDAAPVDAVVPPSTPASLLSLPNDILLAIFKEVSESRHEAIATVGPLRTGEILVNKRIFALARPLLFSHFSIVGDSIDSRISALFEDAEACQAIRDLRLELTRSYARFTKPILSRLSRLSRLEIALDDELDEGHLASVIEGIQLARELRTFTLALFVAPGRDLRQLSTRLFRDFPPPVETYKYEVNNWPLFVRSQRGPLISLEIHRSPAVSDTDVPNYDFSKLRSVSLGGLEYEENPRSGVWLFARKLQEAATSRSPIALERLVLELHFPTRESRLDFRFLNIGNMTRLLESLSSTLVERLEFTLVNWIPKVPQPGSVPSVRVLKISGPVTFKKSLIFAAFSHLLLAFPNLTQLHLVGSSMFGQNVCSDTVVIPHYTPFAFLHPELYALIEYLRGSKVKIFTWRGEDEKRETRWTRLTAEDDFDVDCWTL